MPNIVLPIISCHFPILLSDFTAPFFFHSFSYAFFVQFFYYFFFRLLTLSRFSIGYMPATAISRYIFADINNFSIIVILRHFVTVIADPPTPPFATFLLVMILRVALYIYA